MVLHNTTPFWISLFIPERRFLTKVEIKRFLCSQTSGFNAVCLWKVYVKAFHKDCGMFPFFLNVQFKLQPTYLERKASTVASIRPWILASRRFISWSFGGKFRRTSSDLFSLLGDMSFPRGCLACLITTVLTWVGRIPFSNQLKSLWVNVHCAVNYHWFF